MCLATITKQYKRASQKEVIAYKIFRKVDGKLVTPYYDFHVEQGVWQKKRKAARGSRGLIWVEVYKQGTYRQGFHAFATLAEAEWVLRYFGWADIAYPASERERIILPVKLRGITTFGTDGTSIFRQYIDRKVNTLVANEMYVPKEGEEL